MPDDFAELLAAHPELSAPDSFAGKVEELRAALAEFGSVLLREMLRIGRANA